jgi:hypothetical protein
MLVLRIGSEHVLATVLGFHIEFCSERTSYCSDPCLLLAHLATRMICVNIHRVFIGGIDRVCIHDGPKNSVSRLYR